MKLKKLLCTVLASAMLISGTAVMADEPAEIKFEGEYFNLSLGGKHTAVTDSYIQKGFAEQSNNAGLWVMNEAVPEFDTEFYINEDGAYKMTFLSNRYAEESAKGWRSQFKFDLNGTEYDGSAAKRVEFAKWLGQGEEYAVYEITVALNKGINSLKFTSTSAWNGEANTGKYLLYLDYVKFTPISEISIAGTDVYCKNKNSVYTEGDELCEFSFTVPVAGMYEIKWKTQPHDFNQGWMSPWSLKVNNESISNFTRTSGSAGVTRAEYNVTLPLNQGENKITFVLEECTHPDRAHTYDLYYDYIKCVKTGDILPKTTKIVLEGESPKSKVTTSMDPVAGEGASGKSVGIGGAKTIPASVTYASKVDVAGNYNMKFVLWDYEKEWMTPVAITVKQGDTTVIDKIPLSSTGKYTLYTVVQGENVSESYTCDITAAKESGSVKYGSYEFYTFNWLDDVALEEGNFELTIDYLGMPNNTTMYFGVDAITLAREIDYTNVTIKADETEIFKGTTMQLTATDIYGSVIEAEEDVTTVTWESSNENILSVDNSGLVTAKNPGKATVTLTVGNDGAATTAETEIIVMTQNEKFMIKSVSLEENEVVVKYASKANLNEEKVTLIAGRYPAANTSLSEVQSAEITGDAPNMFRTARIALKSTDGKIKLFSWSDLTDMKPVFNAIEIQ